MTPVSAAGVVMSGEKTTPVAGAPASAAAAPPATGAVKSGTVAGIPSGWLYAVALCMASGMADAIGFIQTGVFAANMTGNTVLAGLSLAAGDWAIAFERAMTLAMFFIGAMLGRSLLRAASGRAWLALTVEAVMLAVAAFLDPKGTAGIWLVTAAMGVQSTGMIRFSGIAISTVVITSTLSRLAESFVDRVVPRRQPANTGPAVTAPRLLASVWIGYGVGALLAALLLKVTDLSLLAPAAIVLLVAVVSAWQREKMG